MGSLRSVSEVIIVFNILAAILAFAAAYLWHKSATIKIPFRDGPGAKGIYPSALIIDGNNDFIDTAITQSRWSKWAAYAAGASALFQGVSLLIQVIYNKSE